jgi:Cysteine-rich secretory protein family
MSIPRGRGGFVCLANAAFLLAAGCDLGTIGGGNGTGSAGTSGSAGTEVSTTGNAGSTSGAGTAGTAGGPTGSAGSSGGAGTSGASDPLNGARQACVDKINAFRATESKAPLARWTAEEACTDAAAKSDSQTGTAHGAFGTCMESAQDECPGWRSVASITESGGCLDKMWAEGPGTPYEDHGHYINMSNPKYTKVACGFYTTPDGKVWAVQNLR